MFWKPAGTTQKNEIFWTKLKLAGLTTETIPFSNLKMFLVENELISLLLYILPWKALMLARLYNIVFHKLATTVASIICG